MATLFRQSRFIVSQLACIRRTAASTGTQAKTAGGPAANAAQAPAAANRSDMAVRDARQRGAPSDAIRPRPAGEPPLM